MLIPVADLPSKKSQVIRWNTCASWGAYNLIIYFFKIFNRDISKIIYKTVILGIHGFI